MGIIYAANPAFSEDRQPVTFIGQYSFNWAGFKLGKLALSIEEKSGAYSVRLGVTSAGVVNLFTRHESDTVATGKITATRYLPQFYESYYKTKKKPRHIKLVFDAEGRITEELNEPPENRAIRPEVPHEKKDGSYDPLTGFLALRSGLNPLTAFDAKRLYEVKAEDKGTGTLSGVDVPVKHYVLSRTPLAGLTEKEKKEYKEGEPPLDLYISDDNRAIPVYMTMPVFMGSVKGRLVKECKTWDECKVK